MPCFVLGLRVRQMVQLLSILFRNLIDVPYSHTAYMEFIYDRLKDKNPDGSIQIMYTIHGRLASLN